MFISDRQWEFLEPILRVERKSNTGRMRSDPRAVFEGLLFVLYTGCQWRYLPESFPPKSTVHDYLKIWNESGAFRTIFARIIRCLVEQGRIDLDTCFVDATFAPAKGGGDAVGLTKRGKGTKTQLVVDGHGIPLAVSIASAGTGETRMVQQTLAFAEEEASPQRLVGDKAYDSDELDETLEALGIEMVAPHRRSRLPETRTQAEAPLWRYRHRWKVERTFAWLGKHRRLLVRHERNASLYLAFVIIGCALISMRHLSLNLSFA